MKSYVGMGHSVCPVCGASHDEVILLNKRLRDTFEEGENLALQWDLCPEHLKMKNDGYIALVECKNEPHILEEAIRTGNIAHVRRSSWGNIFDIPAPKGPLTFVQEGVIQQLQSLGAQCQ